MGGFSSLESITVGGDVVFVGISVNSEVGSFVKSFELAAGCKWGVGLINVDVEVTGK